MSRAVPPGRFGTAAENVRNQRSRIREEEQDMFDEPEADKVHEECGVFGIYEKPGRQAAFDVFSGLIALQHRGQESAGISVSDTEGPKGNLRTRKGMGLVNEVFSMEDLQSMHGNIGIGHVRYSTTGASVPENAQPIAMKYIKGSLALVHNGNIVNAETLRQDQMYRGQAHYTTSDTEVLAYEIISERVKASSIEEAVEHAAKRLEGGYACIVMSPQKLIGFRDPYGIKPLVLGKRGEAYILASESAAIRTVGGERLRDVEPGELVTVTKNGVKTCKIFNQKQAAHCVFEYIYFARPDSVIDGIEVHDARFRAGQALARKDAGPKQPAEYADLVTGVPDSGLAAAEGYAKETGIPFGLAFYKNSYVGRSFIRPSDKERKTTVQRKLSVFEQVVYGKKVVLIDDSIVRGNTMRQIIELLRKAGAAEVHVRISSPPFLYPCYYGTDVPGTRELIAAEHSPSDICRAVGADSLKYLSIEDFRYMVGELPLCAACFNGKYPASIAPFGN